MNPCLLCEATKYCVLFSLPQVDLMFIQTLYGIRDVHKNGIKEEDFSEVSAH